MAEDKQADEGVDDLIPVRWIKCTNWDDLPDGEWLVKIENDRKPYHVAYAGGSHPSRIIIVGNHFSFDMGNIIAYTGFEKYCN